MAEETILASGLSISGQVAAAQASSPGVVIGPPGTGVVWKITLATINVSISGSIPSEFFLYKGLRGSTTPTFQRDHSFSGDNDISPMSPELRVDSDEVITGLWFNAQPGATCTLTLVYDVISWSR